MNPRAFASDNNAGVHPEVLSAIAEANTGHVRGYGDDIYTERAVAQFKRHFGEQAGVFFVFNGTAANVLALQAITRPWNAIICTSNSHIQVDECGAPERFTGCKLIDVTTPDGKLTPALIEAQIYGLGDQHHVQAAAVSITQSTELGTRYTPAEVRAIAETAHRHGLLLHLDGARISNAAAGLGCAFRDFTTDAGVDVLSFGGTKNGLLGGEAVVFLNPALAQSFKFVRKQGMQLASKMRFIAVQFEALLAGDLWLRSASHANAMAQRLAQGLRTTLPNIEITQPVQANAVFARLPRALISELQTRSYFYPWAERADGWDEVRWMCSFDTTEADIDEFIAAVAVAQRTYAHV
jgi:threonine aldolase